MSSELEKFAKLSMIEAFTPGEIVACLDKMEAESNKLKQAHALIIREVEFSTKSRIITLNNIRDISKKVLKK